MEKKKTIYNILNINLSGNYMLSLPDSTATLWSYIQSRDIFQDRFHNLGFILTTKDGVQEEIQKYPQAQNIDFIFVSLYLWNIKRSLKICRLLKELNPKLIIIAGGNEIPEDKTKRINFLRNNNFIDYLICGEGEKPLENILARELSEKENRQYQFDPRGITYKENNNIISAEEKNTFSFKEEINYPGPGSFGIYDDLLECLSGQQLHGALETNRGCPYSCSFCDWELKVKIRKLSLQRVKDELAWLLENVDIIMITDANFGILDRDIDIAKTIVSLVNNKKVRTHTINITYSKNNKNRVLEIAKILATAKINISSASISLQSLDDNVLTAINRKNFDINKNGKTLSNSFIENKLPFYIELILGLPLETEESFLHGWEKSLELLPTEINIFKLSLLKNSIIKTDSHTDKYHITWQELIHKTSPYRDEQEIDYIVRSTGTLDEKSISKIYEFKKLIEVYWFGKIFYYPLRYLKNEYNFKIIDFFKIFHNELLASPKHQSLNILDNDKHYFAFSEEMPFHDYTNQWIYITQDINRLNDSMTILKDITIKMIPNIDLNIFEDLIDFSKHMLISFSFPKKTFKTSYNWYDYFTTKVLSQSSYDISCTYHMAGPYTLDDSSLKNENRKHYHLAGGHSFLFNKRDTFVYQDILLKDKDKIKKYDCCSGIFYEIKN